MVPQSLVVKSKKWFSQNKKQLLQWIFYTKSPFLIVYVEIQLGRFILSSNKYRKVFLCNIILELPKTMKKNMARGIAQKICTALFPLWSLRKNDIAKTKKTYNEKMQKPLKRILIFKQRKIKNKKKYLSVLCSNSKVFSLNITMNYLLQFHLRWLLS